MVEKAFLNESLLLLVYLYTTVMFQIVTARLFHVINCMCFMCPWLRQKKTVTL